MKKIFQPLLLIFCFVFIFGNFSAFSQQSQPRFSHASIVQGLSQSTVNCGLQDKQGFIWIGTQDGLNRFDGYSFTVFRKDASKPNSLSDNYVQSICQDQEGFIWVGTYGGGLNRYDPLRSTFTVYKNDSSNASSLSNNVVMCMQEDKKQNLWIGTQEGLNILNKKTGKITRVPSVKEDVTTLSSNKIRCLYQDKLGRMWVGTSDKGFNLYDEYTGKFTRFLNDPQNENSLSHNFVQAIGEDSKGNLWIGTSGGGVNRFNPSNFNFTHFVNEKGNMNSLPNNDIWVVFEDAHNRMWFGSYGGGLILYDEQNSGFKQYVNNPVNSTSLSNNVVLCSWIDQSGLQWIGTLGGGVDYFEPVRESFIHFKKEAFNGNTLSENMVMCFLDEGDKLWIGTYGGGLNCYNKKTEKFISFQNNPADKKSLSSNIVRCVFRDSKNNLWIGTYGGGLVLFDEKKKEFSSYKNKVNDNTTISNDDVWCITEDASGDLWIGTWNGGLNCLNMKTKVFTAYKNKLGDGSSISSDKVIALFNDRENNLWVGTNGGGLNLMDKISGKFTVFRNNPSDKNSLSNNRVRCIVNGKNGNLWIGTDGGGFNNFDVKKRVFTNYNAVQGLPNDVVYGIVDDNRGSLWLSTNSGISRFKIKNNTFQNFDVKDGLQSNEFNQGAYCRTSEGWICLGGVNGFNIFKPAAIRKNPNVPLVHITSVKLFGKELESEVATSFIKTLSFSHTDNFLSFEFTSLDFVVPEKNQYACKMEGFDKDWIMLGNRRFVSYTNLDPGEYTLRVKGSNNDNVWNEKGTSIRIVITPPFWRTAWFYTLCVLIVLGSIYGFIRWRTYKLNEDKNILANEVALRTREVVYQKDVIERKNKDITDSINYAQRIQQAILPSLQEVKKAVPDSFILFKPKDIVSGDFYWMELWGKDVLLASVDCTGHGVPGAFMSIVAHNLLNQAVNEHGIAVPSLILNAVNKGLSKTLKQDDNQYSLRDGMDIALCAFEKETGKLQYAGANNPLWIVSANSTTVNALKSQHNVTFISGDKYLIEVKADKQPIGRYAQENPFTNHIIQLQKGDTFYIFTDGYADQFGGDKGKKFKYKQLQQLVLSLCDRSMEEQQQILNTTYENWRGDLEQIDDVCLIGVRNS